MQGEFGSYPYKESRVGRWSFSLCLLYWRGIKGTMFETHVNEPGNTNVVSKCVQVAFIVAGCTHAVYYKILKNALGIDAISEPVFMDTIYSMYPINQCLTKCVRLPSKK